MFLTRSSISEEQSGKEFDMPELDLIQHFRLDGPLILAPLGGGPSTPSLVAAVSNAGGLGSLGGAYLSPQSLEAEIREVRSLTSRAFAVNLFIPAPDPPLTNDQISAALSATRMYRQELGLPDPEVKPPFAENFDDQFAVVLRERPAAFSFTFGLLDSDKVRACRERGILTIGTATTLEEGIAVEKSGVDAVVAQGTEAGGHRGIFTPAQGEPGISTLALTKLLSQNLKIPVIAAGGIMDGQGIAAALRAGAQAAQLGTAFLTCKEAGTSAPYREVLLRPGAKTTRLTRAFSGRLARGLENRFMHEMDSSHAAILPYPAQNSFTRDIRQKSAAAGSPDYLSLWAGTGVEHIRQMDAAFLVKTLLRETEVATASASMA
jgi:nitronate monooxygenase